MVKIKIFFYMIKIKIVFYMVKIKIVLLNQTGTLKEGTDEDYPVFLNLLKRTQH